VAEVGTSKPWGGGGGSGSHNKPVGCSASGYMLKALSRNGNRKLPANGLLTET
jgi:hypothetical protein